MKNIFIFLNIILLSSGNLFFTHDHSPHDHSPHDHSPHDHKSEHEPDQHKCIECLTLDNNHFTLNDHYISFINNNYCSFITDEIFDLTSFISCNTPSRSPPVI